MISTFIKIFYTLFYLKPIQILSRLIAWPRLIKILIVKIHLLKYRNANFKNYFDRPAFKKHWYYGDVNWDSNSFKFLDKTVIFGKKIDWNYPDVQKLWLYHLHYFDYLNNSTKKTAHSLLNVILDWIKFNPIGHGVGWEPFTISLRIVNWIFFYFQNEELFSSDINRKFINSIREQVKYLHLSIEYKIQANHLFKNYKALFIAALFFKNDKWLSKFRNKILQQINEQVMKDGGHYERSPMYHTFFVEDLIDIIYCLNIVGMARDEIKKTLVNTTQLMVNWLDKCQQPDGDLPLFGDTALKASPAIYDIAKYAKSNEIDLLASSDSDLLFPNEYSGYYVFKNATQYLIIDGGRLGPDHQPGHAHSDLASFEYSFNSKRFIVDSGIGEYLPTKLRSDCKGVKAHNTIVVDNLDQAEHWSAFRIGRRVNKISTSFNSNAKSAEVTIKYINTIHKKNSYSHSRKVQFINASYFLITDQIRLTTTQSVYALFHFHPDCKLRQTGWGIEATIGNDSINVLYRKSDVSTTFQNSVYIPNFGEVFKNQCVELSTIVEKENELTYIITPKVDEMELQYLLKKLEKSD